MVDGKQSTDGLITQQPFVILWADSVIFCYDESILQKHNKHEYLLSYDFLELQTPEIPETLEIAIWV